MVKWQDAYRRSQPDFLGSLRERCNDHGRRDAGAVPVKVMLAEPEGVESQLLGPLRHGQNFFVIFLVGTTDLRGIIAEYENAKFHTNRSFVAGRPYPLSRDFERHRCRQMTVLILRRKKYPHQTGRDGSTIYVR